MNLKNEYKDIKDKKHKVEHLTVTDSDSQRIVEELFYILTRPNKHRIG